MQYLKLLKSVLIVAICYLIVLGTVAVSCAAGAKSAQGLRPFKRSTRFVYVERNIGGISIILDRETGIHYLHVDSGAGVAMTRLWDKDDD
jgi:hypothetical protein